MPLEKERQSKDLPLAEIRLRTRCCYREHKFPLGDAMRECHFGLSELDQKKCAFCTWFGDANVVPQVKTLTGRELIKLQQFFAELRKDREAPGAS